MIHQQQTMILSSYIELYNLLISRDNMLRQINELVDFSFVYEELKERYCLDNGRNAIVRFECLNICCSKRFSSCLTLI